MSRLHPAPEVFFRCVMSAWWGVLCVPGVLFVGWGIVTGLVCMNRRWFFLERIEKGNGKLRSEWRRKLKIGQLVGGVELREIKGLSEGRREGKPPQDLRTPHPSCGVEAEGSACPW